MPKPESTAAAASEFIERNLKFRIGTLELPAAFCLPAKTNGKISLVALLHGSGPAGPGETYRPNKPFRDPAHGP
jgi:poly(3-hydroxybutyrate) depolymerase